MKSLLLLLVTILIVGIKSTIIILGRILYILVGIVLLVLMAKIISGNKEYKNGRWATNNKAEH